MIIAIVVVVVVVVVVVKSYSCKRPWRPIGL
jgi:hypothetical protein